MLVRRGLFKLGKEDLGGGGTDDSGVDAGETVKALSDVVNGLECSWRKTSIPCSNTQVFDCRCRRGVEKFCFVWSQLAISSEPVFYLVKIGRAHV